MNCTQVTIVGGRYIDCITIEPCKELPGFFKLQTDEGELRIINAQSIVEVLGAKPEEEFQITPEYLQKFYG